MSANGSTAGIGERGIYFFLSYAHTPPVLGAEGSSADHWVTTFFQHLCDEVARLARPGTTMELGFMEEQIPPSEDWRAQVSQALGSSEVFVPLYSPTYLSRSWPLTEEASFERRLAALGSDRARGHIQPVLWVPLGPGNTLAEGALPLGEGIPEYATNGLLAMCRLTLYRKQYKAILVRLAERIVAAAERSPLGRSPAPLVARPDRTAAPEKRFIVGVIAPTVGDRPAGRSAEPYGVRSTAWRPFDDPPTLPAAEYTANVAQRLGLSAEIVDVGAGVGTLRDNPGVILIDPWILAEADGPERLRSTIAELPAWTALVVIVDEKDPQFHDRGRALLDDVTRRLRDDQLHPVAYAQAVPGFVQLVPSVVTRARRLYLNKAPMFPPGETRSRRPRLRDNRDDRDNRDPMSPASEEDR